MAQVRTAVDPLAAMVDELGDLERALLPFKPKLARAEAIRKMLRDKHRDQPAEQNFQVQGSRWTAVLGPCGNQSEILVRKLFRAIGVRRFLDLASVSIKAASASVEPDVLSACTAISNGGSRQLTVVPRVP